MIVYADATSFADRVISPATKPWAPPTDQGTGVHRLCESLYQGTPFHQTSLESDLLWNYLFLVEYAPRSHYGLLIELARGANALPDGVLCLAGSGGPTTIFLTTQLSPHLPGPVAVAAYSYMPQVPIIQPPILRLLTTQREREIDMPQAIPVSKTAVVLFPIVTATVASPAIPSSAPLIGMLMFGNLLRGCGVTERLRKTAGSALIDIVTIFLGLAVGATMDAEHFVS